jgi:hypothetical protein
MTEKNKLILLRLLVVPYFFLTFITTILFMANVFCGFLVLGIPCWILTGDAKKWMRESRLKIPFLWDWDDFREDIHWRQKELDNQKKP